ncbi:hypothetical protein ABZP36_027951 [Zizania latifolia]
MHYPSSRVAAPALLQIRRVFHWFHHHRDGGEGEGAKNHGVQHVSVVLAVSWAPKLKRLIFFLLLFGEFCSKEEEEEVSEPVEKYDHNSDRDCAEIAVDAMVMESVTEDDDNSSKNCIEELG